MCRPRASQLADRTEAQREETRRQQWTSGSPSFGRPRTYRGCAPSVVIGVSVPVAKIVDLLISRFLVRLTLRTNTALDDQLVQVLHRPVFLSVILVGLCIAVKPGPVARR